MTKKYRTKKQKDKSVDECHATALEKVQAMGYGSVEEFYADQRKNR